MGWLVLFFVLLASFGCNADPVTQIAKANEKFTINVYKQLIKTQNGNIIFSGLSAEIILSLLSNGAKGDTLTQLLTGLGLPTDQNTRDTAFKQLTTNLKINTDQLKLLSANKIYPAEGFTVSKSFKKSAVEVYHSDVQNLNYGNKQAAANTINNWVANNTNNRIQNLIDPSLLSPATVLVLVNALYFSGNWVKPFETFNSAKRLFYTSETDSKSIDTMYTEATVKYAYNSCLKAKFLELDFKGGNVSMVFILPDSRTGLGEVEDNLENYLVEQEMKIVRVGITLPKFTTNTKIDFTPILQKLGVTKVFTNQADLTGISSKGNLKVSFVFQKAFLKIAEKGVEAAAATGAGVSLTSVIGGPYIFFNADHPFFYSIRDKNTGVILFAGRFLS